MALSKPDVTTNQPNGDAQYRPQVSQLLNLLKKELDDHTVETWFEDFCRVKICADQVCFSYSSEFYLSRVKSRFEGAIKRSVIRCFGEGFPYSFELEQGESKQCLLEFRETSSDADSSESPAAENSARPNKGKSLNDKSRDLSSFWFGESNRLAEAGVEQIFLHLGQMSPFFVYGPSGCGKTHLLDAIINHGRRNHRLKRSIYMTAEQFTTGFVRSLHGSGLPVFRRKYREVDLLAIDDIQFFAGKNATLAEFQYTVDCLIRQGKQIVLSSDRPPVELQDLGSEVTARMMSGLVCPLNYPDAVGRKKIVFELCKQRGIQIPDDVAGLISNNLARDVRRLSGAINRIYAASVALSRPITLELALNSLTDLFSITGTVTSMKAIEKVVCEFCGVKPAELKSSSRRKKISSARMLAMYLSRQYTSNACSEIGAHFGGRSHSTVIAAEKKVNGWLDKNDSIDLPHAKYSAKDAVVRIESALRIG